MVQAVSYNTAFDYVPAFPGMLADAMFRDVVSVPCGANAVPFGCAVFADATTGRSILPATVSATVIPQGIALHDHNFSGRYLPDVANANDRYVQYDSISVLRRGRVWGRVVGTATKDGAVVTAATADGTLSSTAAGASNIAIPNARFLSANISIVGVIATDAAVNVAMVELHEPTI